MVTIYDLLEVDEKATKEQIEKSYQRLILEYHKDPKLTEQENKENEIILNKLKIAYDILSNDEKRKQYDKDLANKRAEELIKNVSVKSTEKNEKEEINKENESDNQIKQEDESIETEENTELNEEEKKKIINAAKKQFNENLKKAQKAEEEYNKAYNEAYNNYIRKMGYNVKEPWTLKRFKNLVITILAIIIVCVLAWIIPPIRNLLIQIYEENFIVKALVDIVGMIINGIKGIFK